MKNKGLKITSAILLLLVIILISGPRMPKPVLNKELPVISLTSSRGGQYVNAKETAVPNIKPGNASQVLYVNDSTKAQTDYCLLYLHGFSASPEEGNPTHVNIGKAFGMNTYIPRLAEHGLISEDALLNMTPDNLWNSAKEALVVAKALGRKVILMGTSTGGTLALQLVADFPDAIAAVILYSPNIKLANKAAVLLARPFGLQLGRMISGGKYRLIKSDPKTDPYWDIKYRVEAVVYLQQLIEKTMKAKTFKKVNQPVFVGYYYKDEANQDKQVSVSAILWMFDNLGTPADKKSKMAFPDAGDHVIGCDLINPNWLEVYTATADFLTKTVGLTPVNSN
ncbi:MAG: alpha/beta hydrolase [Bacteroidia bacterium]|nr:alpha/beta hydrolase [Bacteroidia bacterium]